jgi:predicted ferric reductase
MNRNVLTIFWVACYVGMALAPLATLLLLRDPPPSRGFWIELSAALGFIALAMFALQFVLTARFRGIGAPHGLDTLLQFHRQAGIVAVVFALMHPVIMIVYEPSYVEFLDPRVNFPRAMALIAVVVGVVLIVALTLQRRRLGVSYEMWRLSHGLLGVLVVIVGLVHVFQVQWYVVEGWQKFLWGSLNIHSERFEIA